MSSFLSYTVEAVKQCISLPQMQLHLPYLQQLLQDMYDYVGVQTLSHHNTIFYIKQVVSSTNNQLHLQ